MQLAGGLNERAGKGLHEIRPGARLDCDRLPRVAGSDAFHLTQQHGLPDPTEPVQDQAVFLSPLGEPCDHQLERGKFVVAACEGRRWRAGAGGLWVGQLLHASKSSALFGDIRSVL